MADDVELRDIDVGDGLTLHVASSGAGPALVLLHGFTGSGRSWDALRTAFEAARRVVTIDLPGHGESSSPRDAARYRLRRVADDIIRVLDALHVDRVSLLGYSLGGRAALRVALTHPGRLRALVLESCSPGIAAPEERTARERSDGELASMIEREGVVRFTGHWEQLPIWATQAALPDAVRARLRTGRLANSAVGLAGSLRGAGVAVEPDVSEQLPGLVTPTLLIAGALDDRYAGIAAAMAHVLPEARLEVVEGAGHAVHLERPDRFASLVGAFLDNFDR